MGQSRAESDGAVARAGAAEATNSCVAAAAAFCAAAGAAIKNEATTPMIVSRAARRLIEFMFGNLR